MPRILIQNSILLMQRLIEGGTYLKTKGFNPTWDGIFNEKMSFLATNCEDREGVFFLFSFHILVDIARY